MKILGPDGFTADKPFFDFLKNIERVAYQIRPVYVARHPDEISGLIQKLSKELGLRTFYSESEIGFELTHLLVGMRGLDYSYSEIEKHINIFAGMIRDGLFGREGYGFSASDYLNLIRGPIESTGGAIKPSAVIYPGQGRSLAPKRKPRQRKRPKPKNRTVYR